MDVLHFRCGCSCLPGIWCPSFMDGEKTYSRYVGSARGLRGMKHRIMEHLNNTHRALQPKKRFYDDWSGDEFFVTAVDFPVETRDKVDRIFGPDKSSHFVLLLETVVIVLSFAYSDKWMKDALGNQPQFLRQLELGLNATSNLEPVATVEQCRQAGRVGGAGRIAQQREQDPDGKCVMETSLGRRLQLVGSRTYALNNMKRLLVNRPTKPRGDARSMAFTVLGCQVSLRW